MKNWRRWSRIPLQTGDGAAGRRLIGVGLATALLTVTRALPAVAQEFVKVDEGAREQLPATPFVGVAYGFIWLAVLLYMLMLARGLTKVNRDLADLRRRLDRSAPETSARP